MNRVLYRQRRLFKGTVAAALLSAALCTQAVVQECRYEPSMDRYCGVNAVRAICALFDAPMTWDLAVALCQPDEDGANTFLDLMRVFERLGMYSVPVQCSFEDLERIGAPAVLHLDTEGRIGHFVVATNIDADSAAILELPRSARRALREEIELTWKGIALLVFSTETAAPSGLRSKASAAWGNKTATAHPPTDETPPLQIGSLRFLSGRLEAGAVPRHSVVRAAFRFENLSNEAIRIVDIQKDCACIASIQSPEAVPPLGKGEIVAEIHPAEEAGRHTKALRLTTDEAGGNVGRLQVSYMAIKDLIASPPRLVFQDASSQTLSILNLFRGNGKIARVEASHPAIEIADPIFADPYFIASELNVRINADAAETPIEGFVRIFFEGAEDAPLTTPVFVERTGLLNVRPREVSFGVVKLGEIVHRVAGLHLPPEATIEGKTVAVSVDNDAVDAKVNAAESQIEFILDSTASRPGLHAGTARVTVDDDPALTIDIPLSWFVN